MSNGIQVGQVLDDLPTIQRGGDDSGVWVERLEPARENEGKWVAIHGPIDNPHPTVNNLRRGVAAGVKPFKPETGTGDYQFAGRTFEVENPETGEPKVDDEGEPVREGYVFARLLTDEQKDELVEAHEAEQAKAEAEASDESAEDEEASLLS